MNGVAKPTFLVAHNHYRLPGGEDEVFAAETALLEAHGFRVIRFTKHNEEVVRRGRLALATSAIWSQQVYYELRELVRRERPRLLHVHNTLPLLSPSIYYAARAEHIPVVQTLHNYRLACPNALLFRDGGICEDCLGRRWATPAVRRRCYRGSRAATALVAFNVGVHRAVGTWNRLVDRYIALSEFARQQFVAAGLPPERLVVKPNFVDPDPGVGAHDGGFALFVGRLSPEKGIETLLAAFQGEQSPVRLWIVGDGPGARLLDSLPPGVTWLRHQPRDAVLALMRHARFLIFPSQCYEGYPLTVLEAFATGLPVIASRLGATAELVRDGVTGIQFTAGDPADLARKVEWALTHPEQVRLIGRRAREEFESRFTAESNIQMMLTIYSEVLGEPLVVRDESSSGSLHADRGHHAGAGRHCLSAAGTAAPTPWQHKGG